MGKDESESMPHGPQTFCCFGVPDLQPLPLPGEVSIAQTGEVDRGSLM